MPFQKDTSCHHIPLPGADMTSVRNDLVKITRQLLPSHIQQIFMDNPSHDMIAFLEAFSAAIALVLAKIEFEKTNKEGKNNGNSKAGT